MCRAMKEGIFFLLFKILLAGASSLTGHPNVLLIVVDDLRPALGCYDDTLALTPNIDALAQQGTIFTRAYAQQALCGPSRTSFLTSRRPDTTRLYDVHSYWRKHAGNFTTLPQYFKEHGYHTVSAGKIFHPGIVSNHSDDQPYSWSEPPFHPPTQAHKQDPVCLGHDGKRHTSIYCPVQVEEQPGRSLPDIQTTEFAVAWLEKRAARQELHKETPAEPFFLAVGYHKPHIPLKFPSQFLDLFPISSIPLAPNPHLPLGLPPVAWNPWNDLRWRADIAALNVSFPYGPMPDYYARYIRQGYYAATTYTDSLIGDLLDSVNTHFPDTIIAFIGDHGWSLGEHQEWSKFSNFEVATRVPFIISRWRHHKTSPFKGFSSVYPRIKKADVHPVSKNHYHEGHVIEDLKRKHVYKDGVETTLNSIFDFLRRSRMFKSYDFENKSRRYESSKMRLISHDGLVELVDLFPTLVDLAGLPALNTCPQESRLTKTCTEGTSLSPLLHFIWDNTGSRAFRAFDTTQSPLASFLGRNKGQDNDDDKGNAEQHSMIKAMQMDPKLLSGIGMKRAAFSQYPRPGLEPSIHPDSDQPPARDTTIMGYSLRTLRFRYAAWVGFNGSTLTPDWSNVVAQELYDHQVDPLEDHNLISHPHYASASIQLHNQLMQGWRQATSVL